VLVVDDNATSRAMISAYLARWGCRPDAAADGATALQRLREAAAQSDPFAVAIIDYMMPEMDGEALGTRIHADPSLNRTKMVMLTSCAPGACTARLRAIGFSASLHKPVRAEALRRCLHDVCAGDGRGFDRSAPPPGNAPGAAPVRAPAPTPLSAPKILVAEDNIINQEVALSLLKSLGYGADVAPNGEAAVRMLRETRYDLVLMDIQMPILDGVEAARAVRRFAGERTQADVPIIATTASALCDERTRRLLADMDDSIAKPLDREAVREKLVRWLSRDSATAPVPSADPDGRAG
jgi:CheY-like chemotaxis protein